MPKPITGLYVHIPFCQVKCRFCDFAAFPGLRKETGRYLSALDREIQTSPHAQRGARLDTIFFGGGTPSILEPEEWRTLWNSITSAYEISDSAEISVECNPESVTAE